MGKKASLNTHNEASPRPYSTWGYDVDSIPPLGGQVLGFTRHMTWESQHHKHHQRQMADKANRLAPRRPQARNQEMWNIQTVSLNMKHPAFHSKVK